MVKSCIYCKTSIESTSVVDMCKLCMHQVWGEKMSEAILQNMQREKQSGNLELGRVGEQAQHNTSQNAHKIEQLEKEIHPIEDEMHHLEKEVSNIEAEVQEIEAEVHPLEKISETSLSFEQAEPEKRDITRAESNFGF